MNNKLDCTDNTDGLCSISQSRLYSLRRLLSFGLRKELLRTCYDSVMESAIFYSMVCWNNDITESERKNLDKVIRKSTFVLGLRCSYSIFLFLIFPVHLSFAVSTLYPALYYPPVQISPLWDNEGFIVFEFLLTTQFWTIADQCGERIGSPSFYNMSGFTMDVATGLTTKDFLI